MITAELEHNPYLLETTIRFNGQEPRINSLVEKYLKEKLQTWIKKVPSIFHDEMNGYDFTLEFTGTKTDFEELKKSFALAGVTSKQVEFILKKQIQDREDKLKELDSLINWLKENPNERFDFKGFYDEHEELFNGAYPFIILQGRSLDASAYDNSEISVEYIDDVNELDDTDLTSTPILICLTRSSLPDLQRNLRYITSRSDVIPEQIFFFVSPELSIQKAMRLVQDLGVVKPRMVKSVNAPSIVRFMELYPYTDYVSEAIRVFNQAVEPITEKLAQDNKENEIKHSETHEKLRAYDKSIESIKNSSAILIAKADVDIPVPKDWLLPKEKLLNSIKTWRKKKVKITNDMDARKEAEEFNKELQEQFIAFCETLQDKAGATQEELTQSLSDDFKLSGIDLENAPEPKSLSVQPPIQLWSITMDLLKLKEERYVEEKEDIVKMLFKQDNAPKHLVKEVTYTYQDWREYALEKAIADAEIQISKWLQVINDDYKEDIRAYLEVLAEHLQQTVKAKQEESKMLSGEEQKLQADNDWMDDFKEQIHMIERG